jgi:DNA-binding NtrC family response regulator
VFLAFKLLLEIALSSNTLAVQTRESSGMIKGQTPGAIQEQIQAQPQAKTIAKPLSVVIDDDSYMLELISDFLAAKDIQTICFNDPTKALTWFTEHKDSDELLATEFIISDVHMPSLDGHDLLAKLNALEVNVPLIFATAFGSVDSALQAMRQGAFDYIVKPFKLKDLDVTISRARKLRAALRENDLLRRTLSQGGHFAGLVGRSEPMRNLFQLIERIAPSRAHVFIQGEGGTGKERVARAIHARGLHSQEPFVTVDCHSIPRSMIEQELFGPAEANTAASRKSGPGLLETVGKGTILISEVGELSQAVQTKLLRAIESRTFRSYGSNRELPFEGRVIASSHRNLVLGETEGSFREDLFLCLNVVTIKVPPLRDRREDIPMLANLFLKNACAANNFEIKRLDASANHFLCRQRWNGNVRQLQNFMERIAVLLPEARVGATDLERLTSPGDTQTTEGWYSKLMTLSELEKEYIQYVLQQTHDRKEETARILGINRRTLYRKEREYDLI